MNELKKITIKQLDILYNDILHWGTYSEEQKIASSLYRFMFETNTFHCTNYDIDFFEIKILEEKKSRKGMY